MRYELMVNNLRIYKILSLALCALMASTSIAKPDLDKESYKLANSKIAKLYKSHELNLLLTPDSALRVAPDFDFITESYNSDKSTKEDRQKIFENQLILIASSEIKDKVKFAKLLEFRSNCYLHKISDSKPLSYYITKMANNLTKETLKVDIELNIPPVDELYIESSKDYGVKFNWLYYCFPGYENRTLWQDSITFRKNDKDTLIVGRNKIDRSVKYVFYVSKFGEAIFYVK